MMRSQIQKWTIPVADEPARRARVILYTTSGVDEVAFHIEDYNKSVQAVITLSLHQASELYEAFNEALSAMESK